MTERPQFNPEGLGLALHAHQVVVAVDLEAPDPVQLWWLQQQLDNRYEAEG